MLIPYKGILEKYNIRPTGCLHIGAHWAQEAKDYYDNGCERSIWVEANPECIYKTISVLAPYPDHLIFNDCLTDTDNEQITFHVSNNEGQSSSILQLQYHTIAHPEVHYLHTLSLKTKRLDTLFSSNNLNIEDYPFVNIDIQGAELLCLKGFGELLHKVKYVYIEINELPLYNSCALLPELKDYLESYGFTMVEKVMSGNHGWGDSLFIRK